MVFQPTLIFAGDGFASLKNRFQALELAGAKSTIHLGDSIVVAQLLVLEPLGGFAASLIAKFPGQRGVIRIVWDSHPALAERDLFIVNVAEVAYAADRHSSVTHELSAASVTRVIDAHKIA